MIESCKKHSCKSVRDDLCHGLVLSPMRISCTIVRSTGLGLLVMRLRNVVSSSMNFQLDTLSVQIELSFLIGLLRTGQKIITCLFPFLFCVHPRPLTAPSYSATSCYFDHLETFVH